MAHPSERLYCMQIPRTYAKQGVTSMKSNESENFFGETLRFSERFSKFSIQQVGERFNKECQPQVPMIASTWWRVVMGFMPFC
eukprot:scaffold14742_cov142-Skeletonema_marinoi.AAC.4